MRATRSWVSVALGTAVAVGAIGCGRRASTAATEAVATSAGHAGASALPPDGGVPTTDAGTDAATAPASATATTTGPAPADVGGPLPPRTFGPTVRLPTVTPVRYRIGGHRIQTVRLPERDSQAALDVELAGLFVDEEGCAITLANPRLVSVTCAGRGSLATMDPEARVAGHFAIGADHHVTRLQIDHLLHPGLEADELALALAAHAPYRQLWWSITPSGLVSYDLEERKVLYPWRTVAPYLRADTPLGELLLAAGLPLAPVGTRSDKMLRSTTAISRPDPSALIADWWRLSPARRADVRLFVPAVDDDEPEAWLWFPRGTTKATVTEDTGGAVPWSQLVEAPTIEPAATIALARTREPVVVRDEIGTRALVERLLPRGAIVATARGAVGFTESQLGRGWAFVGLPGGRAGWVQGRAVVDETCAPTAPADAGLEVTGLATWTRAGRAQPAAWFVSVGEDHARTLALHALADDCTPVELLRSVTVPGAVADLMLASTGGGDDDLLIVVVAPDPADAPRDVLVFATSADGAADAPLYQRRFERGVTVATGVARGGERLPIVMTSGRDRVGLAWRDGQLVDPATVAPTPVKPEGP